MSHLHGSLRDLLEAYPFYPAASHDMAKGMAKGNWQRDRANPAVRTMITSHRMTAGVAGMAIAELLHGLVGFAKLRDGE